jgi:hypothetical protein
MCGLVLIQKEYEFHSELFCNSKDQYFIYLDENKISETFRIKDFFIANDFYKWESVPRSLLIQRGLVKIAPRYRIPPTITKPSILEVMKHEEAEVL